MKIIYFWIAVVRAFTPKLCIHCTFFKQDPFTELKYGKCVKFPLSERTSYVDGKPHTRTEEYYYCSIARNFEDMCGESAALYEPKVNPKI